MLNKDLQLNTKLFDKDVEKVPTRNGFGDGLLAAAEKNENIVGLCADLTESTRMEKFAKAYPSRFIETGIMEQHMVSCASGMAAMGKIPFAASYAMFNSGRNWEQIRTTVAYNNMPVKIIGSHSGLAVGPDGGTHQALEDIAIMRVIPNMEVVVPCDALETEKAVHALVASDKPTYLRLAREKSPIITSSETPFKIGKAYILYESKDPQVSIIAIGPMVHTALLAAKYLEEDGIGCIVVNSPTIKPLDKETILAVAKKTNAVVTAEAHQVAGGLGSTIAELLVQEYPIPMEFVGVRDAFGQSGTGDELMKEYNLDIEGIVAVVKAVIKKK